MKAYWVFYLRPKNFISIIINQILKQKWSGTEKSLDIKVELPPPPSDFQPRARRCDLPGEVVFGR